MRNIITKLILLLILVTASSASTPAFDFIDGRHNNVCKDLRNDALLYFVFIDSRSTYPWTEFDILTTIDRIQLPASCIESQAGENGIPLKNKTDYYILD